MVYYYYSDYLNNEQTYPAILSRAYSTTYWSQEVTCFEVQVFLKIFVNLCTYGKTTIVLVTERE